MKKIRRTFRLPRINLGLALKSLFFLLAIVGFISWSQSARAAGGVFTIQVLPNQPSYPTGGPVAFTINYQCSGGPTDTCDDIFISMPMPSGMSGIGVISGSGQTVSHSFDNTTANWQFQSVVPAGSSGSVTVSWVTDNYNTPNGTVYTATADVHSGSLTGPVVYTDTDTVSVTATADWLTVFSPDTINPIVMGHNYTYTVGIFYNPLSPNFGRLNLENLVYVETLPINATYVSSSDAGVYDPIGHTVTWPAVNTGAYVDQNGDQNIGSSSRPVLTRKVTVIYNSPPNQDLDIVTNQVSWTANGYGDVLDLHSDSMSRTNVLTNTLSLDGLISKGDDNESRTQGDYKPWRLWLENYSNTEVSGTITEVLPCVDNVSLNIYISGNDPTVPCSNPATRVEGINFDQGLGNDSRGADVSQIRWWTNAGHSGSHTMSGLTPLTNSDMGIPSGEWPTAFEFDYTLEAGVDPNNMPLLTIRLDGTVDTSLDTGDLVRNIASFTMTNGVDTINGSDNADLHIIDKLAVVRTEIYDAAGIGISYRPADRITWRSNFINECAGVQGRDIYPDWYIAIPIGLEFINGSVQLLNIPPAIGQPESITSSPGTNNLAGYTILHLKWPTGTMLPFCTGNNDESVIRISFQTMVAPALAQGQYNNWPPNYLSPPALSPRAIMSYPLITDGTGLAWGIGDDQDINGDNDTAQATRPNSSLWDVNLASLAFGHVLVQGSEDLTFNYMGNTFPGSTSQYRMNLMNASNDGSVLRDFVFYTTLPRVGDYYVSQSFAGVPRESDTNVYLTGPVSAPSGVDVQYSISDNPCRDEVYPNMANVGCVNDWVPDSLISDWSKVKAIRFALGFARTYGPGDGETVYVPVVMDGTAQAGDIAWLSIAYRATNAGTGIPLLASEAQRVGLKVVGPALTISKEANPTSGQAVGEGGIVTYSLYVYNNGDVDLQNVTVTDDLVDVLDNADFVGGSLTVSGIPGAPNATLSGTTLTWVGDIAEDEELVISYQVKVRPGSIGDLLINHLEARGRVLGTSSNVIARCYPTGQTYCDVQHHIVRFPFAANTGLMMREYLSNPVYLGGLLVGGVLAVITAIIFLRRRSDRVVLKGRY